MNLYYRLKAGSSWSAGELRRGMAAVRWGPGSQSKLPAVLGNAMPKSGSHLIIQVLQGLTRLGPFRQPWLPPR